MKILITGADGFVGRALVARLLASPERIDALVLIDQRFERAPEDPRVQTVTGDIGDRALLDRAVGDGVDHVFHLASIPGGLAEAQFELGLRVNLEATVALLECLRTRARAPRCVFASTIGVYGVPLPPLIDESTPALPTLSYGAHKLIGEKLVADYSRRGFIEGRSLRLPGIVARPPQPSGMLSAFMSDLIRKLSAGESFACPVGPDGKAWWMSRSCLIDNLLHAVNLNLPEDAAKGARVWLLPVLHASMADIVAAIARVRGREVLKRVTYGSNAALEAQFARLPPLECPQSVALGFHNDGTLESLVQRAVEGP